MKADDAHTHSHSRSYICPKVCIILVVLQMHFVLFLTLANISRFGQSH
jgi:hypothetical protein